jgi:hypothetical protein
MAGIGSPRKKKPPEKRFRNSINYLKQPLQALEKKSSKTRVK